MADVTPAAQIMENIRAERARRDLDQGDVQERMRMLGYSWHRPTVGKLERGERRLLAEEVAPLAVALDATMSDLMLPRKDGVFFVFPSGVKIAAVRMLSNDGSLTWDTGNKPVMSEPSHDPDVMKAAAEGFQKMLERAVSKMLDEGDPRVLKLVEAVLARQSGGQ